MPKFDELRTAVSVLKSDSDAYWTKLYKVFAVFNSQLRTYWGIDNGVVLDNAGNQFPVFATGVFDQDKNEIIPRAPFMLPKEGKKLCFDLILNLPEEGGNDIALKNKIRIKVQKDNDVYLLEGDGIPSPISCGEIDGVVALTPFFDALHTQLLNYLKFHK